MRAVTVRSLGGIAAFALAACAGPRVLAPRAAPSAAMPRVELPAEPPAVGLARLVIEATDGAMDVAAQNVERFSGASTAAVRSGTLCRTPCVVDLPYGRYKLFFSGLASDPSRGDVAEVELERGLTVLRRAPGKYETPEYLPAGPIALSVGATVATTVGLVVFATDEDGRVAGAALALGGIGLAIAAVATMPHRAEQQAGASTVFHRALAAPEPSLPTASTGAPAAVPPAPAIEAVPEPNHDTEETAP